MCVNEEQVRTAFFELYPRVKYTAAYRQNKGHNDYPCTIRCMFCDFVEYMARNGRISDELARTATL